MLVKELLPLIHEDADVYVCISDLKNAKAYISSLFPNKKKEIMGMTSFRDLEEFSREDNNYNVLYEHGIANIHLNCRDKIGLDHTNSYVLNFKIVYIYDDDCICIEAKPI